ncbi:MAG: hypothetical protein RJA50_1123 [Actinomycetota bacterium]
MNKNNQRADLLLLLFSVFATAAANSVVFASMSELQEQYGYADSALGLIAGTGFAMGLLVQLFVAPLADRGYGKNLIQVGLGLAAIGSVIFAMGDSLLTFVFARGVVGASIGMTFPAVRALAAHLDENRSAERLGAVAGMEIGGFVSGPLIGSLIIGPFGLDATFLMFGALAVVAILIISPRKFPELASNTESQRLSFDLLRIRNVRVALILTLAVTFPTGMFDALWDRFLDDLGGNNAMTGLTFAVYGLPFIFFSARAGKMIDKRSPMAVALWLVVPISLLTVLYGVIKNPWVILGVGLFEGLVHDSGCALGNCQGCACRARVCGSRFVGRSKRVWADGCSIHCAVNLWCIRRVHHIFCCRDWYCRNRQHCWLHALAQSALIISR